MEIFIGGSIGYLTYLITGKSSLGELLLELGICYMACYGIYSRPFTITAISFWIVTFIHRFFGVPVWIAPVVLLVYGGCVIYGKRLAVKRLHHSRRFR